MVDRNKIGPVTRDQIIILLRRRVLKAGTHVWNPDLPRYLPLEEIDDLAPYLPEPELSSFQEVVEEPEEQPALKGFTRLFIPKARHTKEPAVAAGTGRLAAPFSRPHRLGDNEEESAPSQAKRPAIPGAPAEALAKSVRTSVPFKSVETEEKALSAAKQVKGAVSGGMRLLGASALSVGSGLFGVFVLGLITLLIGAQRDIIYNSISFLIPREFLTLLDPVEWMGVLIVGGLVGSAASAGCGGRGNASIGFIAAVCAFFSVALGAIFSEILITTIETDQALAVMVLLPTSWLDGLTAFYHNLMEEPDDLLFLLGAAGEAFLLARHNYRRHEDEAEGRVVDPFLKT